MHREIYGATEALIFKTQFAFASFAINVLNQQRLMKAETMQNAAAYCLMALLCF